MYKKIRPLLFALALVINCPLLSFAQSEPLSPETKVQRSITVTGSSEGKNRVAGSATRLDKEELEELLSGPDDINRILREIPGVNLQEEDAFGLRPNIGFRGTDVERSGAITLMEDSVLIAPAPYAAPSAYYFPPVGRMEGLEVLKGAGQIQYGPRTIGGSLNLFSRSIPTEDSFGANFSLGSDAFYKLHTHGGTSGERYGFVLETYQTHSDGFKDLDGGGDTGFRIQDYLGKFRVNTDPVAEFYQEVELKLNYYDQESQETYVGLTQSDFDMDPYRRYRATQLDEMNVDHQQIQVRHFIEFNEDLSLTTTLYRNDVDRNWYKLEKVGGEGASSILANPENFVDEMAWIQGADSPDDTFDLRNNNRDYFARGIQTNLDGAFKTGSIDHRIKGGVRFHQDEEDRFQNENSYRMEDGRLVLTSMGAPGSNANRVGKARAWAFHLQDEMGVLDDLTLIPGVRVERIHYTREDFGKEDPLRTGDDLARTDNTFTEVLPGLGAVYDINEEFDAFFGIHRGFSPPGPASNSEVDPEESINYELGTTYDGEDSLDGELTFFISDYDNLLGEDTLSGGGTGSGDLFNGGDAFIWGVESAIGYDLTEVVSLPFQVPLRATYTYTSAEFGSDFESDFFGSVSDGDNVPYIAQNQISASAGIAHEQYGSVTFRGRFVDSMPTAAGPSGERDSTDSFFVADLNIEVPVFTEEKSNGVFYVDVLNLFDNDYVVARRPAGARPGLPFSAFSGIRINL